MAAIKRPVKRTDPKSRPIDPLEGMTRVVDADPSKRYVWAPEHGMLDVNYYESLGYTKVMREEGGARPARLVNGQLGTPIVQFGSILMEIDREEYKEGIYGPGQDDMTKLESRIYDKEFARREISRVGGIKGMLGAEEIDAVNETSPLTPGY